MRATVQINCEERIDTPFELANEIEAKEDEHSQFLNNNSQKEETLIKHVNVYMIMKSLEE